MNCSCITSVFHTMSMVSSSAIEGSFQLVNKVVKFVDGIVLGHHPSKEHSDTESQSTIIKIPETKEKDLSKAPSLNTAFAINIAMFLIAGFTATKFGEKTIVPIYLMMLATKIHKSAMRLLEDRKGLLKKYAFTLGIVSGSAVLDLFYQFLANGKVGPIESFESLKSFHFFLLGTICLIEVLFKDIGLSIRKDKKEKADNKIKEKGDDKLSARVLQLEGQIELLLEQQKNDTSVPMV